MILLIKKNVFVWSLLACTLMIVVYSIFIFFEIRQSCFSEILSLCDKVIHQDKEYRLKETDITSSSFGYKSSGRDSSAVLYFDSHIEKVDKNLKSVELKSEEKQYRCDQSILLIENPIDIVVLDSLFNLTLQQNKINVNAALTYTVNNDKTIFSNPDLDFYQSASALEPISTGVKDEIVIQTYIDIPFSYVINRNRNHFIILLAVFCLIIGIISTTRFSKIIPIKEKPRTLTKIKENLLFDREKGILYFNDDIQVSLINYKLKFFVLLLDSPGYFQTSEEMKKIVWGIATPDRLNKTIERLRDDLQLIPDLEIIHEYGGYRLNILK